MLNPIETFTTPDQQVIYEIDSFHGPGFPKSKYFHEQFLCWMIFQYYLENTNNTILKRYKDRNKHTEMVKRELEQLQKRLEAMTVNEERKEEEEETKEEKKDEAKEKKQKGKGKGKKRNLTAKEEKKMTLDSKTVLHDVEMDERLKDAEKVFGNKGYLKYDKFNAYISKNQSMPKSVKQLKANKLLLVGVTDCVSQHNGNDCGLCTIMNTFMVARAYLKVSSFINDFKNLEVVRKGVKMRDITGADISRFQEHDTDLVQHGIFYTISSLWLHKYYE